MSRVDLHIHSTASDGRFTPAEIVHRAHVSGLQYIALCDHDSLEGLRPAQIAARECPSVTLIPGVEINTDIPGGELHILGYLFDTGHEELRVTTDRLRNSRVERARCMVAKLNRLGVDINFERVQELAGSGAIGRPHVAQAMLEKNYINSFREAFVKYIYRGGPAYVEREKVTPVAAIKLIRRAGGLPVVAHPLTCGNPEALIRELKESGLAGVEAYYVNYTADQIEGLVEIARTHDLLITGGSDFHGLDLTGETVIGGVEVPIECAERLVARGRAPED